MDAMDEDGEDGGVDGEGDGEGGGDVVWLRRRRELEVNLTVMQNGGFCGDSYEDLRGLVEKILETARWLSGGDLGKMGALS
ncbi:hypothetical protein HDU67_000261 [Dinochytrium kinnereticum]|nr:hypothetical protein HDU67_000261 [Dinochytrium kinnereticum]